MKVVGLTGGIGSGKSFVAKLFGTMGIPVYSSDQRAKWITNHHPDVIEKIKSLFGDNAYLNDALNSEFIASQVFNDKQLLSQLNEIVHPAVGLDFKDWVSDQHGCNYVLKEAAILFESGSYRSCDEVILVSAPQELRIKRVMSRDSVGQTEVERRIKSQWSDDKKRELANYEIINDESVELLPQIYPIHNKILGS